ncbi:hypothetical protein D6779_07630 [Candidatus Parcubacteria bacterium]|nr:MAG: hypothetical protein D6779_07630 [Candidatus Parcubacteria bacterium]
MQLPDGSCTPATAYLLLRLRRMVNSYYQVVPLGEQEELHHENEIAPFPIQTIPDSTFESQEAYLDKKEFRRALFHLFSLLTPREALVLMLRFGIGRDGRNLTLNAIGRSFRPPICRERVRQIEASAMKKLKKLLEKYYPEFAR